MSLPFAIISFSPPFFNFKAIQRRNNLKIEGEKAKTRPFSFLKFNGIP
jgi:hypothetical protein